MDFLKLQRSTTLSVTALRYNKAKIGKTTTAQVCASTTVMNKCTPAATTTATRICSSLPVICETASLTLPTPRKATPITHISRKSTRSSSSSGKDSNTNAAQSPPQLLLASGLSSWRSWRSCIVGLVTLLVFTANFSISAGQIDWDDDDDPAASQNGIL
ncbi:uncharacterized protein LOC129251090 isoform X1 [Anastrepha obliqua]|uniref:uncharacterized protein LOC129251090 isoform X1 n=1 Tax=Anastrepha obliqua TaxID=95512 RepID=UPI002409D361|nr:uncharacterized protein LOC129251090 isoform X1 [Anastrepha obliqua]XP_054746474.1 uncharacterized protein LOC129251090 isoform X1 [Anastrepha obliqua]